MEQYISKSAVVAEIMSRIDSIEVSHKAGLIKKRDAETKIILFKSILSIIDTLEVKEVDMEKAIDDYIYTHDGRKRLTLELDWKYCNLTLKGGDEIIKFAKHFFELGIKASQKGEKYDIQREEE